MTLDDAQQDRLKRQLHAWRSDLLDLTRRQSLLYFKHTKSASLEIASPGPAGALASVETGASLLEVDGYELQVVGKTSEELARATRRIDQVSRQALADRGVWTLYLGLGMLRWIDPDDQKPVDSPLVLVPVELRHTASSAPYSVHRSGDGISSNFALQRKLSEAVGLVLPEVDENDTDVDDYLAEVNALVAGRPGWEVHERVILRNFSFHKEAMYRDLEENESAVLGHPLVQLLTLGAGAPGAGDHDFTPTPDAELDEVVPPEKLFSILSADSSQRKCILAAREGRSFVMDGPPGTGKSQTIANIIAELIGNGRSVLFVSEKAAALDVVRERLADRGLGPFLLELHSHTSGRKQVAVALDEALGSRPVSPPGLDAVQVAQVVAARRDLSDYAQALNEVRQPIARSAYAVVGRLVTLARSAALGGTDRPEWSGLTSQRLAEVRHSAEQLAQVWAPVEQGEGYPWRGLAGDHPDASTVRRLSERARALRDATSALLERMASVEYDIPVGFPHSLSGAERHLALLEVLRDAPSVPSSWLTTTDWRALSSRVEELHTATTEHHALGTTLAAAVGPQWEELDPDDVAVLAGARGAAGTWHVPGDASVGELDAGLEVLRSSTDRTRSILDDAHRIATAFGLPASDLTLDRARDLAQLGSLSQTTTPPEAAWLNPSLQAVLAESCRVLEHLVTLTREREGAVRTTFTRAALELDLVGLKTRFEQTHRGLRAFSGAARRDKKLLREATVAGRVDKTTLALLDEAISWQQAEWALDVGEADHAGALGGYYRRADTDFGRVSSALTATRDALRLAGDSLDPQALARQVSTERIPDPHLVGAATRLEASVGAWRSALLGLRGAETASLLRRPLTEIDAWCAEGAARMAPVATAVNKVAVVAGRPVTLHEAWEALQHAEAARAVRWQLEATASEDHRVLGPLYRGLTTDWDAIAASLDWADRLRQTVGGAVAPSLVDRLTRPTLAPNELRDPLAAWSVARSDLVGAFDINQRPDLADDLASDLDEAVEIAQRMVDTAGADIDVWFAFARRLAGLRNDGLEDLMTTLTAQRVHRDVVPDAVEHAVLEAWLDSVVAGDARLHDYAASERDEVVRRFRDLDRQVIDKAYTGVVAACAARRPRSLVGDAAIIRRQAQLKTRHMPIREVLAQAGTVAKQVKPCFMMSPLSVSQYLPGSMTFDVVIFDEASQVAPSDAINCIYRGQQLIVAGDQKQLPPTSFFAAAGGDEDDEEEFDDFGSVLDLCKGAGALPSLPLNWHYRSQHEDLITFSNYKFYDGRLHTFPGARFEAPDLGVASYHVQGTYQRGGSRDNPVEAAAVAERVIEHHRYHPELSMGVVALSTAQADAIEAAIEQRVAEDPSLEALLERGDRLAGFFIKNLESVQGDERDVIIFSTGYGPDENGKVTTNFGPVTRKGGWRRLNVAITRARRRIEVVTSLHHSQIEPGANESHRHLRDYLHFAEKGRSALALDLDGSLGDAESPFEEEVIRVLQSWGHHVVPQVGAAGYRIDIGVRHPDRPGEYLLAIECDGAAYHSARAARDRDRLREEVLVGLGWRVHRIWGLSWYRDRAGQEARLEAALNAALTADGVPVSDHLSRPSAAEVDVVTVDLASRPRWAVPYETSPDSPPYCYFEPHTADAKPYLRRYFEKVIAVEAPVHQDVLFKRFRADWGVGSVGKRIRENILAVIDVISIDGVPVRRDVHSGFVRARSSGPAVVRVPTDEVKRKVGEVPPEELETALLHLVKDAGSVTEEQLSEALARTFGWARRGPDIQAATSGSLEKLVQTGRVSRAPDGRVS